VKKCKFEGCWTTVYFTFLANFIFKLIEEYRMRSFTSKSLTLMRGKLLLAGLMISLLALVVSCGGGGGDTTVTVTNTGYDTVDTVPLTGTVYDSQGQPVAGATVSVLSTLYSAQTAMDGSFTINVEAAPHTVIVSKDGLTDSFKLVDLTGSSTGATTEPFLLMAEPAVGSPINRFASGSYSITSNLVNGTSATLTVPAQTSGTYTVVGSEPSASSYISLQYFDVHEPLPFPLPTASNRDSSLNFSIDKLAPISVVSVKPVLLTGLAPAATLELPNPTAGTPRILRFDSQQHKWVDAVTGGLLANANSTTSFTITEGGIYGIFEESGNTVGSISGTIPAPAGSQVFVGDQVITTTRDNEYINLRDVHIPLDDSPLQITIVDPSTTPPTLRQTTVTTVAAGTATIKQPGEPEKLSLALSQTTVKSDNSDSATITSTVLDSANVGVQGVTVSFSSSGGKMSASSVVTDADGNASITFSSGTIERKNQLVTITASVGSLPAKSIPVQVVGTTISLENQNTSLEIGGADTGTLVITVKDAGDQVIYDAPVSISIRGDSTGTATLSTTSGSTDVNGTLSVDVTGTGAGVVNVEVSSLGATSVQSFTVSTTGQSFGIILPATDTYSLATNTDLTITVQAPGQADVTFATTVGAWDGGSSTLVTKAVPADGVVSAVLKSSEAGIATVQVIDAADSSITDTIKVAVSASVTDAAILSLQAAAANVLPSSGDSVNTVDLTATVKTSSGQVVGNAPVVFYIEHPVGGGEYLFPVITMTDDSGVARTTFSAGSQSSGAQGLNIVAEVVGTTIQDKANIIIGGTAGSIVMGVSTKIVELDTNTYQFPVSLLVTDSNGSPMPNATISLSVWPKKFNTGYWVEEIDAAGETVCRVAGFEQYVNEDTNRNLILDAGEDSGANPGSGDGILTPPNSSAGAVPATVTTDENGLAKFDYIYLKNYSVWIETELKATTEVQGTESSSVLSFVLPYLETDACYRHPAGEQSDGYRQPLHAAS
jgi:hypothetical protein